MHPDDFLVKKFWLHIILTCIWDSAFCLILCPFMEFVLLGSLFASWAGPWESQSVVSSLFNAIVITWALSWSCPYYGLCRIVFPCFWAVLHLCVMIWLCCGGVLCFWSVSCLCELNAWSHDLEFLHDLKLTLDNSHDVQPEPGDWVWE